MPSNIERDEELYIILSDYVNDLHDLKKRDGELPAQAAVKRLKAREERLVREAKDDIANWLRYEATIKTVYNIKPFTNGQYVNILDVFEKLGTTREPQQGTQDSHE